MTFTPPADPKDTLIAELSSQVALLRASVEQAANSVFSGLSERGKTHLLADLHKVLDSTAAPGTTRALAEGLFRLVDQLGLSLHSEPPHESIRKLIITLRQGLNGLHVEVAALRALVIRVDQELLHLPDNSFARALLRASIMPELARTDADHATLSVIPTTELARLKDLAWRYEELQS